MSSQRNTGAFILGGVIGGVVGAVVTLWNTPKSGDELRSMLSGGSSASAESKGTGQAVVEPVGETTRGRFSNPVLSFVERAAAPIVGVELGKLARDDPKSAQYQPVRASAADAKPPSHDDNSTLPYTDTTFDDEVVANVRDSTSPQAAAVGRRELDDNSSPGWDEGAQDDQAPSDDKHIAHEQVDFEDQHVATVEELTSPPPETADAGTDQKDTTKNREPSPFPDMERNNRT